MLGPRFPMKILPSGMDCQATSSSPALHQLALITVLCQDHQGHSTEEAGTAHPKPASQIHQALLRNMMAEGTWIWIPKHQLADIVHLILEARPFPMACSPPLSALTLPSFPSDSLSHPFLFPIRSSFPSISLFHPFLSKSTPLIYHPGSGLQGDLFNGCDSTAPATGMVPLAGIDSGDHSLNSQVHFVINTGTEGSAAQSEYGGHFSAIAAHTRTTPAVGVRSSSTTLTPTSSPSATTSTLGLPGRELANDTPSTTTPPTDHQDQMMPGTGALFADGEAPPGTDRGSDGDSPNLGQWDRTPPGLGHGTRHHPSFDKGSGLLPSNPVTQTPSVQPTSREPKRNSGQSTTGRSARQEQTQVPNQRQSDILKSHGYIEDHGRHLNSWGSECRTSDEYEARSDISSTYTGEMDSASAPPAQVPTHDPRTFQDRLPQRRPKSTFEHGFRQGRHSNGSVCPSSDHSSPCQSTLSPSSKPLTAKISLSRSSPSYGRVGSIRSDSSHSTVGSSSTEIRDHQDARISPQVDPTLSLANTLDAPNLGGRFELSEALPMEPQCYYGPADTFIVSTHDKAESGLVAHTVPIQREFVEASLTRPLHHDSYQRSSDHQHDASFNYTPDAIEIDRKTLTEARYPSSAPARANSACSGVEDEGSNGSISPDENHRAPSGRVVNTEAASLDDSGSTRGRGLIASAIHKNCEFNVCNSLVRGN